MKKLTVNIFAIINIAVVLGLWATGYLSYVITADQPLLSVAGYAFPAFLAATVASILFWVIFKWKMLIIPVVGLLVAYKPVTLYYPVNGQKETTDNGQQTTDKPGASGLSTLRILSYNSGGLYNEGIYEDEDGNVGQRILRYIRTQKPDIVCLQEGFEPQYQDSLQQLYRYYAVERTDSGSQVIVATNYPITRTQRLPIVSKGNIAAAFWLQIPVGATHSDSVAADKRKYREVCLVNVHLETMGFTVSDKELFSSMMHGKQDESKMESTSHLIIGKMLQKARIRTKQADGVADFVSRQQTTAHGQQSRQEALLLCGDFNDGPQSYTYHRIASGLTDCYKERGWGFGFSFSHYGMRARIDNIMCNDAFTPIRCKVDDTINASDHYPIMAEVKW